MNALDYKVLRVLMQNGRISWAELATLLGLSAPAAAERVRRLEASGVIKGYSATVDAEAAGCPLAAFIAITLQDAQSRAAFLARIQALPEVQECHHVAGEDDYLMKVRCRGTADLDRIISDELKSLPGVLRTRTTVILSTQKETAALPLAEVVADR